MTLIFISIIWFLSEVILSRLLHSQTKTDYDKSSLRVLWITIMLSVSIGIYLHFSGIGQINFLPLLFYYLGILLIFIGLAIRWTAILTLKKSFTVNVSVLIQQTIIRSGIYKTVRHPSYLGSLLSFLGLGLAFGNWLTVLVIFLPICLAFLYRIKVEENVLKQAFPNDYNDYIKSTKRLIPGIY
jgi:protein-S-isoprenylcysteine O-methyltransferase Ste14